MQIVFMGTPSYATTILKSLLTCKKHNIVALFTQPDKPVGRKKVLTPPHIKEFIEQENHNIPIFQPKTLKDETIITALKELQPDMIIVAAYGQILTQEVLNIAPCINLHASLLPKYRGASPIQAAILENEAYSGVTAMLMDEGLDTGDMLGFSYVKLDKNTTSEELFETLSHKAASLTLKILDTFQTLHPLKQNNANSTYAPKIKKQNGLVDIYKMSADEIERKYYALHPWPGIFLPNGVKLLSLEAFFAEDKMGLITKIDKSGFALACKKGFLYITKVQPPSKKPMDASAYIQGQRKKVGDTLY